MTADDILVLIILGVGLSSRDDNKFDNMSWPVPCEGIYIFLYNASDCIRTIDNRPCFLLFWDHNPLRTSLYVT